MQTLAELMSIYQSHHTKESTKVTHFIGVPCILFALQILLNIPYLAWLNISYAWIAVILLLFYYLILDIPLALITAAFLLPLTYVAQEIVLHASNLTAFILAFVLFILGIIMQFVGHYHYEKNKPALIESFFQIFVAPIFLVAEIIFALGYKKNLQQKILQLAVLRSSSKPRLH